MDKKTTDLYKKLIKQCEKQQIPVVVILGSQEHVYVATGGDIIDNIARSLIKSKDLRDAFSEAQLAIINAHPEANE